MIRNRNLQTGLLNLDKMEDYFKEDTPIEDEPKGKSIQEH